MPAILNTASGLRNSARWSVALALGLRQGEALGLQWADLDTAAKTLRVRRSVQRQTWQHGCTEQPADPTCGRIRGADCPDRHGGGILLVETKTRTSRRTIVLPPPLLAELRAHRHVQMEESLQKGRVQMQSLDLIFPDPYGRPIDPAQDHRDWKALVAKAGVRRVRLHDARHTAATLLLVQGVDLRTVMAIMGWTEMATAQRYAHAVDELRINAARQMGDLLWPKTVLP